MCRSASLEGRAMVPERRHQAGFTLLEAVVALAILAAGGMALFAALSGALRSLERADAAARLDTATENALALIEASNPMLEPKGDALVGEYRLEWHAMPVEPIREGLTDYLQLGLYDVGLYDVEITLSREGRVERRLVVRRAGYRQMRQQELG